MEEVVPKMARRRGSDAGQYCTNMVRSSPSYERWAKMARPTIRSLGFPIVWISAVSFSWSTSCLVEIDILHYNTANLLKNPQKLMVILTILTSKKTEQ